MTGHHSGDDVSAPERWDRVLRAMAAEPRRLIVASLSDVPAERRLPLPETAMSPTFDIEPKKLEVQLRHHHLPLLADRGYVRWESDPFCVQRGPRFEEAAAFIEMVFDSADGLPDKLIDGCAELEAVTERP
jgi:hypothetical protein